VFRRLFLQLENGVWHVDEEDDVDRVSVSWESFWGKVNTAYNQKGPRSFEDPHSKLLNDIISLALNGLLHQYRKGVIDRKSDYSTRRESKRH